MPRAAQYLLAGLLALYVLTPLALALGISLNPDNTDVLANMGSWRALWPHEIGLDNYWAVWGDPFHPYPRYLLNTAFITASVVLGSLLVNSALGFALAWGGGGRRRGAIVFVVALIAVPAEALAPPLLLMSARVGALDGYAVQIVPFVANALFVFLFYQFFVRLPRDLIDAARIDGMGVARIYWHIGLPAAGPVCACVAILQFIAIWNSYLWPVMVTHSAEARPLSVAMSAYFGSEPIHWGKVMAFALGMALPVLLIALALQRRFVAAITASSVKG